MVVVVVGGASVGLAVGVALHQSNIIPPERVTGKSPMGPNDGSRRVHTIGNSIRVEAKTVAFSYFVETVTVPVVVGF